MTANTNASNNSVLYGGGVWGGGVFRKVQLLLLNTEKIHPHPLSTGIPASRCRVAAGDPSAAAHAAQAVRDAVAAAGEAEAEAGRLLRRHAALCRGYLDALGSVHGVLLQLVEGSLVGKQARLDAEHCRWLVSHVRTLHR
jgi:hypothetical protein